MDQQWQTVGARRDSLNRNVPSLVGSRLTLQSPSRDTLGAKRSPTASRSARRGTGTRCTGGTASTSLARNLLKSRICTRRRHVAAASSSRLLEGKSSKRMNQPMSAALTPSSTPATGQRSICVSERSILCLQEKTLQADLKGSLVCSRLLSQDQGH